MKTNEQELMINNIRKLGDLRDTEVSKIELECLYYRNEKF